MLLYLVKGQDLGAALHWCVSYGSTYVLEEAATIKFSWATLLPLSSLCSYSIIMLHVSGRPCQLQCDVQYYDGGGGEKLVESVWCALHHSSILATPVRIGCNLTCQMECVQSKYSGCFHHYHCYW